MFDFNFGDSLTFVWEVISHPFFEFSGNKISLLTLIIALGVGALTWFFSGKIERIVYFWLKRKNLDRGVHDSLSRLVRYITLGLGLAFTLEIVGISLSSLAALGAVLMVGIGFGLQNIAQNFISGLIILFERPIRVGDVVQVGGVSGRVVEIQARSTLIITRDDVSILVPNSQFISEQVINESFSGSKIRHVIKIGVAYGSDIDLIKKILLEVAHGHGDVLRDPNPDVLFVDFGESSLDFELRVWIQDLWRYKIILSDLRFEIDKKFRLNQITIPFPQRDIHLYPTKV